MRVREEEESVARESKNEKVNRKERLLPYHRVHR